MYRILYLLLALFCSHSFAQTLPSARSVDWTISGLRDTTTLGFIEFDMQAQGLVGDGVTPNDSLLDLVLAAIADTGAILQFPAGSFLFHETINLPDNSVIRGDGAESTTFIFDLGGTGHSFNVSGSANNSISTNLTDTGWKDQDYIEVSDPTLFSSGDWIQLIQNDSNLVTSSWAIRTVGQIVQIETIVNNKLILGSPLRMKYDLARMPYVIRLNPAKNVGIECLKILRLDDTAPSQTSNVNYSYAVNCWINGIESENCTFSHVKANRSSNIHVSKSYFHHGFSYGGGGRAYGVMLQLTTNECLIENNIFEHLRHSMIVQAGANGNVFAYNYSHDPYWESLPNNSAGDAVLHGNYVYANLFEQNICQNIVIDNSHGPNGPYNTFLRNRAEKYGIFFSATNSPDQNFLGNEIPNENIPYSLVNYSILGSGHFLHGNNNKGTIHPSGTETLIDSSYAYNQIMSFGTTNDWAGIGTPNTMESGTISAYERFHQDDIFRNSCGDNSVGIDEQSPTPELINIYPNPFQTEFTLSCSTFIQSIKIVDVLGDELFQTENLGFTYHFSTDEWKNGIYFIQIIGSDGSIHTKNVIKFRGYH